MAREIKFSVAGLLRSIRKATKAGEKVKQTADAVKRTEDRVENKLSNKAELREVKRAERAARAEAKIARAERRSIANRLFADSRVDPRRIYSTAGNLREKLPTLARAFTNPAESLVSGISAFGEGLAGISQAMPFMAAAGGFLAVLQPVLQQIDQLVKERVRTEVQNELERTADLVFADRFRNDPRFAQNQTNDAIDSFLAQNSAYKRAGWIDEGFVEFEGF